jgi:hypothetical protein
MSEISKRKKCPRCNRHKFPSSWSISELMCDKCFQDQKNYKIVKCINCNNEFSTYNNMRLCDKCKQPWKYGNCWHWQGIKHK